MMQESVEQENEDLWCNRTQPRPLMHYLAWEDHHHLLLLKVIVVAQKVQVGSSQVGEEDFYSRHAMSWGVRISPTIYQVYLTISK